MIKFAGLTLSHDLAPKQQRLIGKAQNAIDKKCIELMEEYTPEAKPKYPNHGKMKRAHRQETPGVIINTEPKARREYYTNKGGSGGKRGKLWFERMKLDHKGEILKAAEDEIK